MAKATVVDQLRSLLAGLPDPDRRWADDRGRPCVGWARGARRVEVVFDPDGVYRMASSVDDGQWTSRVVDEYRTVRAAAKRLGEWLA